MAATIPVAGGLSVSAFILDSLLQIIAGLYAYDIYTDTKETMEEIETQNMQLANDLWESDKNIKNLLPSMYAAAGEFPSRNDCDVSLALRKNSVFQITSERHLPAMQVFGKGLIGMKKYVLRQAGVAAAAETSARMGGARRFEMLLTEEYEKDRVLALVSKGSNARYAFGIPGALKAAADGYTGLNALAADSLKGTIGAFSRTFHNTFQTPIEERVKQARETTNQKETSVRQQLLNDIFNAKEQDRIRARQQVGVQTTTDKIIEEDLLE